jgi:anti-sigma regulatory factor (Ser/Thr protein kinase)
LPANSRAQHRRTRFVARGLCERGQTHHRPTVVDDCGLVVGELIANAIQADANTIDVSVELHHGRIGLAVTDDAHGWPVLHPPDLDATGGTRVADHRRAGRLLGRNDRRGSTHHRLGAAVL